MRKIRKRFIFILVVLTMLLCIPSGSFMAGAAASLEGTGQSSEPYKLRSLDDLKIFAEIVKTDPDACAILMSSIIGSSGDTIEPIGAEGYSGTFNGNFYKISDISVTQTSNSTGTTYGGLFADLKNGAVIKNLSLSLSLMSAANYSGVLAGEVESGAFVFNCHALSGSTVGNISLGVNGGLVGINKGIVSGCSSNTQVTSGSVMGGFVGENQGSITACWATPYWVLASIASYGSPDANDNIAGGFTGKNSGQILASIVNYCGVSVSGNNCTVGGFAGSNETSGVIDACLSLTAQNAGTGTGVACGAFAGKNSGTVSASYFSNVNTTVITACGSGPAAGITGDGYNLLNASAYSGSSRWNFSDPEPKMENGVTYKWTAPGGSVYPRLEITITETQIGAQEPPLPPANPDPRPEGTLKGLGTEDFPYEINDFNDLKLFSWLTRNDKENHSAFVVLKTDIDAGDTALKPIGDTMFGYGGQFDGGGYTISNLEIAVVTDVVGISYAGLFSNLGQGAVVKDLSISAKATVSADFAGILAGYADKARIVNCHILAGSSLVNEKQTNTNPAGTAINLDSGNTGGLVGANYLGLITACTAAAAVRGGDDTGGLAGYNDGIIAASGAENSEVTGGNASNSNNTYTGALVGENNGILAAVYAKAGTVNAAGTSFSCTGALVGRNSNRGVISAAYTNTPVKISASPDASSLAAAFGGANVNRIMASYADEAAAGNLELLGETGNVNIISTLSSDSVKPSSFKGSERWSFSAASPVSEYGVEYYWSLDASNYPDLKIVSANVPVLPSENDISNLFRQ